mmetsp:Transcript_81627/g.264459  ORF Transcript_81627/g.264459 Transcript_81627/m.264459 type:complete len:200 (-) Transcript_81627:195-794(-)
MSVPLMVLGNGVPGGGAGLPRNSASSAQPCRLTSNSSSRCGGTRARTSSWKSSYSVWFTRAPSRRRFASSAWKESLSSKYTHVLMSQELRPPPMKAACLSASGSSSLCGNQWQSMGRSTTRYIPASVAVLFDTPSAPLMARDQLRHSRFISTTFASGLASTSGGRSRVMPCGRTACTPHWRIGPTMSAAVTPSSSMSRM